MMLPHKLYILGLVTSDPLGGSTVEYVGAQDPNSQGSDTASTDRMSAWVLPGSPTVLWWVHWMWVD